MATTPGTGRSAAARTPAVKAAPPPGPAQAASAADRYVVPLLHVAVPASLVHFGASRDQARTDRYVTPIGHKQIPAHWVDYGIWGALGLAVASEGITLPIAGALGVGAFLRRRTRPPRP